MWVRSAEGPGRWQNQKMKELREQGVSKKGETDRQSGNAPKENKLRVNK
jgi:hypothetical protein